MERRRIATTAAGFAAAFAVFAAVFWFVGARRVLAALDGARPELVLLVVIVGVGWLAAWSLALYVILGTLDAPVSVPASFFVFASATCLNNLTPFGQAGGEPLSAMLISRVSGSRYETGLAAIASLDALNFAPSVAFAAVGLTYYALTVSLGARLRIAAATVAGLAVVIPGGLYVTWHRRHGLQRRIAVALSRLFAGVGGAIPGASPPGAAAVERRIGGFVEAVEAVAGGRRRLAMALGFAALGWFLQAVGLWTALYALGVPVSFAVPLFIVPIATIAGVAPLPGGLGGIESVLILLLISATAVPVASATAAVIVFRGVIYWLPVLLGGGALAVFSRPVVSF